MQLASCYRNYRRSAKFKSKMAESQFASSDEIVVDQMKLYVKKNKGITK